MKSFIGVLGVSLSGVYLFIRIKYLVKHGFEGLKKRVLQNICDFVLVGSIFILSILQLQGSSKSPSGADSPSYIKYIIILFVIYLIWMKVNVSHYRKKLQKK